MGPQQNSSSVLGFWQNHPSSFHFFPAAFRSSTFLCQVWFGRPILRFHRRSQLRTGFVTFLAGFCFRVYDRSILKSFSLHLSIYSTKVYLKNERWQETSVTDDKDTIVYCPSCHRQLGQQQSPSISGDPEPRSIRSPMNVSFASTVRLHVILGQRLLRPSSFYLTATLGMEPWSLRNIRPIHLHHLLSRCNCNFYTVLVALI